MNFFKKAKFNQIKGEFSTFYIADEYAAQNMFKFDPDIKIIAILRNPIDRTFSNYNFGIQLGKIDSISFEEALEKVPEIAKRSFYYKNLKRYFDIFPHKNIKIMFFDDLKRDPESFLKEVENFLGVKEFIPSNIHDRSNVTAGCRFQKFAFFMQQARVRIRNVDSTILMHMIRFLQLDKIHRWTIKHNKKSIGIKPKMNDETRKQLNEYFADDIKKLEKLINRNLSHWK